MTRLTLFCRNPAKYVWAHIQQAGTSSTIERLCASIAMPALQMSRSERVSLEKVLKRPCLLADIPFDHAEKLLNYGLVKREAMLLHATPLGQVEILRQRFRRDGSSLAARRAL